MITKSKTMANALHSGAFVMKTHKGSGAMTEMPTVSQPVGAVYLPPVNDKDIKENTVQALKAHEYGHIAIAERGIIPMSFLPEFAAMGASDYLVQVCLDTAVNAFISRNCRHLPLQVYSMKPAKFMEMFNALPTHDQALCLLQMRGVHEFGFTGYAGKNDPEFLPKQSLLARYVKKLLKILIEKPAGRKLRDASEDLLTYCNNTIGISSKKFNYAKFLSLCERLLREVEISQKLEEAQEDFKENAAGDLEFAKDESMSWGMMSIVEPVLENSMMRNWKQKHVPRYVGSLRYMHRSLTDMKVWGLKDRSIPPLAVLVDCSGSMHLDDKNVAQILEMQPASVIAGYSGSGPKGSLYMLGKDGKFATVEVINKVRDETGYGNIVDGPALTWLSQQKGRLIWISDGQATGSYECTSAAMMHFIKHMLDKYNIEMYYSVNHFAQNTRTEFYVPKWMR